MEDNDYKKMLEVVFTSLRNFVFSVILSEIKSKTHKSIGENTLQQKINDVLSNYQEHFENIDFSGEYDMQGLLDYINSHLMKDIDTYLYGTNNHVRNRAYNNIINNGINNSSAKTCEARSNVKKLLNDLLEIIKSSYKELIDKGTLLAVNEAANDVIEAVDGSEQRIAGKIDDLSKRINTLSSQSEIKSVADMKKFMQSKEMDMSKLHILFPEYGFKYENDEMYSRPLSPNAEKKYPPHFEGIAEINIGETNINVIDGAAINLSYRRQQPIEIHIKEIKKMLGNIEDPIQVEAEKLKGEFLYIDPAPFPEAFAVSLICDNNVIFDYIKLRTKSILDDGTYLVTNEEQKEAKYDFRLQINTEKKSISCNIVSKSCETDILLSIARFIKCCVQHKRLTFKHLETGSLFLEGNVNINSKEVSIEQIDAEIDLLEKIGILENYYKKEIGVNKVVTEKDYELITYVSKLINGDEITVHWSEFSVPINVTQNTKNNFEKMKGKTKELTYIGKASLCLFGEEYKVPISRTIKNIKIKNYDAIMKKLEVMDIGDSTTIEFIALNDDSVYVDRFYSGEIPNKEQLTS